MTERLNNAKNLYLEGIRDGNARQAVETYTGNRYTQHSTGVADGVEGFVAFFEPFIKKNPVRDIQIMRSIEDGQYVFLHAYQNLNNGETEWVTTDFFDTDEEGKIVEHWDVISAYVPKTPSGHSSIDGSTDIDNLNKTELNKVIVQSLIEDALMTDGNRTRINEWMADNYIEHAAINMLAACADTPLVYDDIVLLVGEGNFVATLCKASLSGEPLAQVDVFRLEDDKIVEHWDNSEPVPANDVNSGKF